MYYFFLTYRFGCAHFSFSWFHFSSTKEVKIVIRWVVLPDLKSTSLPSWITLRILTKISHVRHRQFSDVSSSGHGRNEQNNSPSCRLERGEKQLMNYIFFYNYRLTVTEFVLDWRKVKLESLHRCICFPQGMYKF